MPNRTVNTPLKSAVQHKKPSKFLRGLIALPLALTAVILTASTLTGLGLFVMNVGAQSTLALGGLLIAGVSGYTVPYITKGIKIIMSGDDTPSKAEKKPARKEKQKPARSFKNLFGLNKIFNTKNKPAAKSPTSKPAVEPSQNTTRGPQS